MVYLHIESCVLKTICLFFILCLQLGFSQSIWQPVPNLFTNPDGLRFEDTFFLNENIGWAANGPNASIHKTIDGGLTWTEQLNHTDLGASYYFRNIEFLNSDIGFSGTLNGGLTWTEQLNHTDLGASYYFRNIEFLNSDIGFSGTLNGGFFKATDGGVTWNVITDISPNPPAICGISTVESSTVYACGSYFSPAHLYKLH